MRARSVFLSGALCFVAGAQASAQRTASGRDIELYARLMAMTDSRSFSRQLVDSALASSFAPLRAAAALAVGQVGSAHGLPGAPLLRELLADPDPSVASNAAYAIGLLRDSASVRALTAALGGGPKVSREAAWALGEIGAPASSSITTALANRGVDEARTIQLLLAAAKLKPVPVASVRPYLAMANPPSIQWAAAYAIARTRSPAGVRDLLMFTARRDVMQHSATNSRAASPGRPSTATGPDAYVSPATGLQRARAEIARGLAKAAAGDSLADQAVAALNGLVLDSHPHVRINAVRSLATYGPRARAAVVAATRDVDANTRIAAAQSLGTVLDSTTAAWSPLWSADTSLMYRASLLASAVHAGAILPQFVSWQGHPDWRYRLAVANAAGGSTDPRLPMRLGSEMLADKDARVRAAAYGLIAGADTLILLPTHDALVRGLTDQDFIVRANVLGALVSKPSAADVGAVLDEYARSSRDASNDARIAAIQYVAAAWKNDSAAFGQPLRDRLAKLPPSTDPLVRQPAVGVSVFSGWSSTSGTPRPMSWYENVVKTYVIPAQNGQAQHATIRTRRGDVVLELFGADAPITVDNFLTLARNGFYRGTGFHRVVPNFVAQDGDPRDDGNGGPGYAIRDEMNPRRYDRGALGMALSGPDTGGSQYFITHSPQPHLDGHYTVFGRVVRGFAALDAIVQGDRILAIVPR